MKCRECGNEMYVDHVRLSEDRQVETYVYVCVNPRCKDYRKAVSLMGGEENTQIKEKNMKDKG